MPEKEKKTFSPSPRDMCRITIQKKKRNKNKA